MLFNEGNKKISYMYTVATRIKDLPISLHINGKSSDNLSPYVKTSRIYSKLPVSGPQIMDSIIDMSGDESMFDGKSFSSFRAAAEAVSDLGLTSGDASDGDPVCQIANILAAIIGCEYIPASEEIMSHRSGAYGFTWAFDDDQAVIKTLLDEYGSDEYTLSLIDMIDKKNGANSDPKGRLDAFKKIRLNMAKGLDVFAAKASSFYVPKSQGIEEFECAQDIRNEAKAMRNASMILSSTSRRLDDDDMNNIATAIHSCKCDVKDLDLYKTLARHFGMIFDIDDTMARKDIANKMSRTIKYDEIKNKLISILR
jgi:hypothetical protein